MLPDLVSLKLFISAVERKSISKASIECNIALAAASRRISILEDCYGIKLLYRSNKGVEATPAGLNLAFHAKTILERELLLRAELSDFLKGIKGHIRLQANTSAITQFLPDDLAKFSTIYPDVKIELSEDRSSDITQALRESKADIGIIVEGQLTDGLTCYQYREDRLVAVLPDNHEIKSETASFSEIIEFDVVGLDSNTAMMRLLLTAAAQMRKAIKLRVQVSSFEAVCKFVQAGMGIGILPERVARDFGKYLGLRSVYLTDLWASRKIYLCVKSMPSLSSTTRKLVEHLVKDTDV